THTHPPHKHTHRETGTPTNTHSEEQTHKHKHTQGYTYTLINTQTHTHTHTHTEWSYKLGLVRTPKRQQGCLPLLGGQCDLHTHQPFFKGPIFRKRLGDSWDRNVCDSVHACVCVCSYILPELASLELVFKAGLHSSVCVCVCACVRACGCVYVCM